MTARATLTGRPTGNPQDLVPTVRLGLAANRQQFALLVLVNAFVGAMVGLERATLPLAAKHDFHLATASAALSFIAVFGLTKALTNLAAGWLMDRHSRRAILIAGWLFALPVPFMVMWAPTWSWIVLANGFLGVSQGLAWSATVIMKIDLIGPERRGFAVGVNEFAGYFSLAMATMASGVLASTFGYRTGPGYLGVAIVAAALLITTLFVRDTSPHVQVEEGETTVFARASRLHAILRRFWSDRALVSVSQAGFVNNLNDGVMWGVLPLFVAAQNISVRGIGVLMAVYPAVWGVSQLWTGPLSDRHGRKPLIVAGMIVQGMALLALPFSRHLLLWIAELAALGVGTALVYPTLLAAAGDATRASSRATAVGVYRLWRDLGYVAGAVAGGLLADAFGMTTAIAGVGALTIASGLLFVSRFDAHSPIGRA